MTTRMHGLDWHLLGRGDEYIIKENSYSALLGSPKSMQRTDAWLDIGANFGSFALRAAQLVDRVVAIEPFPANVEHLIQNIEFNRIQNVEVIEAAAIGGPSGPVNLAIGKTFDYTHRVGYVRGRNNIEVDGININELISLNGINKIKMDCEGSEWELIQNADFTNIDELILEWHFTLIPDPDWTKMEEARKILESYGFFMQRIPEGPPTKRWTAIIWCRKESRL